MLCCFCFNFKAKLSRHGNRQKHEKHENREKHEKYDTHDIPLNNKNSDEVNKILEDMSIAIIFNSVQIDKVSKITPLFRSAPTSIEFDKTIEFDYYYKKLYPRTYTLMSKSPRFLE